MQNIQKSLLATAFCSLFLTGCSGNYSSEISSQQQVVDSASERQNPHSAYDLTILHINDHHSHIEAETFDFDVSELGLSTVAQSGSPVEKVQVTFGGFPMLKTMYDELSDGKDNVLKLHAGDAITGTLYYSLFNGEADAAVMNTICFDAFALGNHEFDDGDSGLARFLDYLRTGDCQTPVLAANVIPGKDSAIVDGYFTPYTIIERRGEKIGIVGIDIAGKTKNSSSPDRDTIFLNEVETAQKYIDILTAKGINKIVLLTHYGLENDLALASSITGADVIIGGDSHSLTGNMQNFNRINKAFNPVASYPALVQDSNGQFQPVTDAAGNQVCVVQAWEYARLLGKLDVSFDSNGEVLSCGGQPHIPISAEYQYQFNDDETRVLSAGDTKLVTQALQSIPEIKLTEADPAVTQIISGFKKHSEELVNTVLGTVSENLCIERFPGQGRSTICERGATYNSGSDISHIVAKAFMTVTPTADIGLQNGGGVRVDVATGELTISDVFTLLPFSNTLVTFDMTGEQIVTVLEEAINNGVSEGGSRGAYPYASGLRFDVDASASFGQRVSNVEVNPRVGKQWTPIDMQATYTVVTNDFIGSGREGYETFARLTFENTFTEYAQGFIDYVKQLTEQGKTLSKLPQSEYSTKSYTDRSGCNHATDNTCPGY